MKYVRASLVVLVVLAAGLLNTAVASADTLSASGKIVISGQVLPAHYVVVNSNGVIIEIESNTTQDTTPLVYKDKLLKGNEQPLTQDIYDQYLKIVPPGSSHVGILYKRPAQTAKVVLAHPVDTPSLPVLDLSIFGNLPLTF